MEQRRMHHDDPQAVITFQTVITGCRTEQLRHNPETTWCYELFRRALVLNEPEAWIAIQAQFGRMVFAWVKRSLHEVERLVEEELAQFAWAQFWRYCGGTRFAGFPSTGHLLGFLHKCAITAVLNYRRTQNREAKAMALVIAAARTAPELRDPATIALSNLATAEQLQRIRAWLEQHASPDERAIFQYSFEAGLQPKEIVAHDGERFPDLEKVRSIKENLLKRLRRDLGNTRTTDADEWRQPSPSGVE